MPPDPRTHAGVSAWVEREDHLLLLRRTGKGEFASDGYGTWCIPGGWLDYGESDYYAAERETFEETLVVVKAYERMGYTVGQSDNNEFTIVTCFLKCEYLDGEPVINEPEKCDAVEWVPLKDLCKLRLFHPMERFIAEHGGFE